MLTKKRWTPRHRYLFVGGLHRSGTSLTARIVASLEDVAAIENAPVPENEGVYLQGGIPHDALSGRPMHFATDPSQHLTEAHPLNRLDTRLRLDHDWAPWFGSGKWRVEKSPVNLTRTRLLQQLFPLSQYLLVIRHPEAVAAASAKWVDASPSTNINHWLDAHDRLLSDLPRLHAAAVLRYEDITDRPAAHRAAIAAFLDLPTSTGPMPEDISNRNRDYHGAPAMTDAQAARAKRWGYSPGLRVDTTWMPAIQHPLRNVRSATMDAVRS